MKVWIVFSVHKEGDTPVVESVWDSEDKAEAEVVYYHSSHKYFHYYSFFYEEFNVK